MKRPNAFFLLTFSLSIALFSCQDNRSQPEDTAGQPQSSEKPTLGTPGMITDARQLPALIDYEGDFLQAAQWPGQGTIYYVIVSKYEQGEFYSPSRAARLNIYLFEIAGSQLVGRRAFQAEAPNNYSEVSLRADQSQVINLPSVGMVLSMVYSICPTGGGACSIFSSVVSPEGKYDFQVQEDVEQSVYMEARQALMGNIPKDVQDHMLKQLFGGE